MKKSYSLLHYRRLHRLYDKLQARLRSNFSSGRFQRLTQIQRYSLLRRLEKLGARLQYLQQGLQLTGTVLSVAAVLHSNQACAQFVKQGTEFQVNTYTSSEQEQPLVALNDNGDFVVAWSSNGADGDDFGVFAQRYQADGTSVGSEFQVNDVTTNAQLLSDLTMDEAGNFIVAWTSNSASGSSSNIYAKRYDASGTALGGEFQVNNVTTASLQQSAASIAMDNNGDFVVAWQKQYYGFHDFDLFARCYGADGVAKSNEFLLSTYTLGAQQDAKVAMDEAGDFVATWGGYGASSTSGMSIYAQCFDASGTAKGPAFQVNEQTLTHQGYADVAMDQTGDFIICWPNNSFDGSSYTYSIYAQRYDLTGTAAGTPFIVNTPSTDPQFQPKVAMNKLTHEFIIAWTDNGSDGDETGIFAQAFTANGLALGDEFQVNTYTTGQQSYPAIAMNTNNEMVTTWNSYLQVGTSLDIFAQRFNFVVTANQPGIGTSTFNFFPNPTKDQVHLSFDGSDVVHVKVLNLSGLVLSEQSVSDKIIHVEGLQPGIYLLELNKEGTATERKKLMID